MLPEIIPQDFQISDLLKFGRRTWGDDKMDLTKILVRLMVGIGDLARMARGAEKDRIQSEMAQAALEKEMGNIIVSTIRWCDDLGLDPAICVARAMCAQREFAEKNKFR